MSIIERLLGKKPKTVPNLESEIEAQNAAIEAARAKIATALSARKAAIEEFDADGHRAADDAIAEACREIERRENAIEKLNAAHTERVDLDHREAFRRDDANLTATGAALAKRIQAEYPGAAGIIAKIAEDLLAHRRARQAMAERGRALRETSTAADPEDFRGTTPKRWSVSRLAPEGGHKITAPVEDAPRGAVKWIDGEPVAARDGVEVRLRGGGSTADSLIYAIGNLPKLGVGEGYHREAPEELKPGSRCIPQ